MSKKNFSPNNFIGDIGDMPEYVKGCYGLKDKSDCLIRIVSAFSGLRFFIPVVVENNSEETGFVVDDFAGEKVILAFSNIDDFNSCFPNARPMPFLGKDLVSLALRMNIGRILLDKGSKDLLVGRQAVYCIDTETEWVPVWKNESLFEELGSVLAQITGIKGYQVRCGSKCETEVLIAVECGKEDVKEIVIEVKKLLSNFYRFLQSTDSIEIIPFKA